MKNKTKQRIISTSARHLSGLEQYEIPRNCSCTVVLHEPYGYIYFKRFFWQSLRDGVSLSLRKITNIRRCSEEELKSTFSWTDYSAVSSILGSAAGLLFASNKKPYKKDILIIEYVSNGRKCAIALKEKDDKRFKKFQDVLYERNRFNRRM